MQCRGAILSSRCLYVDIFFFEHTNNKYIIIRLLIIITSYNNNIFIIIYVYRYFEREERIQQHLLKLSSALFFHSQDMIPRVREVMTIIHNARTRYVNENPMEFLNRSAHRFVSNPKLSPHEVPTFLKHQRKKAQVIALPFFLLIRLFELQYPILLIPLANCVK